MSSRSPRKIDTHGGASIGGSVEINGGAFAGRDITTNQYGDSRNEALYNSKGGTRFLIVLGTMLALAGFCICAFGIGQLIYGGFLDVCHHGAPLAGSYAQASQQIARAEACEHNRMVAAFRWMPHGAALLLGGAVLATIGQLTYRRR